MAEYPSLPLWTDAWVADTHHLTRLQRGTYFDLLVLMWRTPGCRVPNDDQWLGAHLHMTESEVCNELRPLIKDLCQNDGNWITQKRLMREYQWVRAHSVAQSERAKHRWQKQKDISQRSTRSGNAPTPTPTPTPTPIVKKQSSSKSPSADFEVFWLACPRKVGKGQARKAYERAVKGAQPALLLAAMRRYAISRKGEPEIYTAHPATWLNGERWLDVLNGKGAAPSAAQQATADALAAVADEERENLIRMGVIKDAH